MELRVYLDFLQRRWWLLLLGPILAGLAAYFVSQQLTPVYQASATILVNRTTTPGAIIDYNDILTAERLTNTYAQLVTKPAVLDDVKTRLNLTITRQELEKKLEVHPLRDTQLLSLSVKDPDPAFAVTLADTLATVFAEDNAKQPSAAGTVSIAKPAQIPETPISPKVMFNVVFAMVLGGLLVVGLALLLDYLDDTVKTSEDVESLAGVATLGTIGRYRTETGPAFARDLHSRSAEAYRQLRTNVHFTAMGRELKTIVITSANPGEGKSTTAANLATVLAQAGDRVILVDTDLRRSSLRKTFDTQASFGLTGLLLNDIPDPSLALVSTRWKNLRLLPTGVLPPNPSELLTSSRMIRVMQLLREQADYVIFDSPPILAVTDAIVLAARTDGTILVAESGGTRTEALRMASRLLKQANAHVVGVVLNKAKVSLSGDYYYRSDEERPVEIAPEPAEVLDAKAIAAVEDAANLKAAVVEKPARAVEALPAAPTPEVKQPVVEVRPVVQAPAAVQTPTVPPVQQPAAPVVQAPASVAPTPRVEPRPAAATPAPVQPALSRPVFNKPAASAQPGISATEIVAAAARLAPDPVEKKPAPVAAPRASAPVAAPQPRPAVAAAPAPVAARLPAAPPVIPKPVQASTPAPVSPAGPAQAPQSNTVPAPPPQQAPQPKPPVAPPGPRPSEASVAPPPARSAPRPEDSALARPATVQRRREPMTRVEDSERRPIDINSARSQPSALRVLQAASKLSEPSLPSRTTVSASRPAAAGHEPSRQSGDAVLDQRFAAIRSGSYPAVTSGNGHSAESATPGSSMKDVLAGLDNAVGMIRALAPEGKDGGRAGL